MPTRAEIVDTLAASQRQLLAFFQGLSQEELERPVTASEAPKEPPWRAKDHLAHLIDNERILQAMLRRVLDGENPDAILRSMYPPGMEIPSIPGDFSALTPQEKEQLVTGVAKLNQNYVNEHYSDSLEALLADYLATREDTLTLLQEFTDEKLTALIPTVVHPQTIDNMFIGRAGHEANHIQWIQESLQKGV